jgi:aryl-alcohol dehydrogenase-like predicted oxidoreductase
MASESRLRSRREILQAGVATGMIASLPATVRSQVAGEPANAVITRPIPSSGEAIPVMGLGTNQFGRTDYNNVRNVLARMHAMGGRVIDTAAGYGGSEEAIGRALSELNLSNEMFIATKFNAPGGRGLGGLESIERSFERLQMDSVDLMFIHSINSVEPMMPELIALKESGRARYIGITSVSRQQHPQVMQYMREFPIDFIQIDYSLGNRAAATDVFPLAIERGIAVMLAVPFRAGRSSLFSIVGDRELPDWADEIGASSWAEVFLKYCVSHPAVTCAIPGTDDVDHTEENQRAGHGTLPDEAMRQRIERFWDQIA